MKKIVIDKQMKERLMSHGIWISNKVKSLNNSQALVLIGQSLFERFISEFSSVWKELFPGCQIQYFEANQKDWKQWLGDDYQAFNKCKEVVCKMEFDIQDRVDEYIDMLDRIRPKVDSEEVAVAVLHEICKDRRSEAMRREDRKPRENGATEKQKRLMRELKIRYPGDVSKIEASKLIDQYFESE